MAKNKQNIPTEMELFTDGMKVAVHYLFENGYTKYGFSEKYLLGEIKKYIDKINK